MQLLPIRRDYRDAQRRLPINTQNYTNSKLVFKHDKLHCCFRAPYPRNPRECPHILYISWNESYWSTFLRC